MCLADPPRRFDNVVMQQPGCLSADANVYATVHAHDYWCRAAHDRSFVIIMPQLEDCRDPGRSTGAIVEMITIGRSHVRHVRRSSKM